MPVAASAIALWAIAAFAVRATAVENYNVTVAGAEFGLPNIAALENMALRTTDSQAATDAAFL
jgi:hypothetical protein